MLQTNPKITKKKTAALEHFRAGKLQEAKDLFDWVVKKEPGDWESWNMLGAIHGMLGDNARCEMCCRKVLKIQPGAFTTYNNLGNALKHQGKVAEAEDAYTRAITIQPQYAEAYSNLGGLLREQGDTARAEECLRKALALKPDHAGACNNLGSVCLDKGELQAAVAYYNRSLELNPQQHDALYNLGCGYMSLGQNVQAADFFHRYLALQPGHVEAWMSLAMVFAQLKKFDEAVASAGRAIALDEHSADAHFVLGSTYQTMGEDARARSEYEKALLLKPDHAAAGYFKSMLAGELPEHAPHEYVRDLFDTYAHKFDNDLTRNLEYRTPEHISRLLREYVSTGMGKLKVMDLGCGTGLVGPLIRDLCRELAGVDLSPRMIAMARDKGVYDRLIVGDVVEPLTASPASYDAVIAADVFVYIGNLDAVFGASREALVGGGYFVFSTETEQGEGEYLLRESGRYAHTDSYVQYLSGKYGFKMLHSENVVLRKEGGSAIQGTLYVLECGG